jgi:hypothetical protein
MNRPSTVLCELLFSLFIWKRDSCTLTFKSHPTHENTLCGNSLQASHLILTFFVRKVTVAFNCVICAWPKHTITCLVFNWTVSFAWSNSTTARNQFSYQQSSNNVPWIFFFFLHRERIQGSIISSCIEQDNSINALDCMARNFYKY